MPVKLLFSSFVSSLGSLSSVEGRFLCKFFLMLARYSEKLFGKVNDVQERVKSV